MCHDNEVLYTAFVVGVLSLISNKQAQDNSLSGTCTLPDA